MAIEFACPSCGGTLQVGDESAGRVIRCGGCMTALRVPAADAAAAPESPAAPNPYGNQSYPPPPPPPPSRRSAEPTEVEPLPEDSPAAARPVSPRRRDRDRDDQDDDRRERRSRRRPPPPPAGKGVFFWLVIIGAIMLVGVVGCCGGILVLLPDTKWRPHESQDGGFRVELPGEPSRDVAKAAGLTLDKGTRAEGTILLRRAEKFMVIYRDIEKAKKRATTDEQELDERVKKLQNGMKVERPARGVSIIVDGFPAREVEFQAETGWHKARVVIADTRVYIVLAGGGMAHPGDDDEVQHFLESFKITDKALAAEGKRRAEQAKREADEAKAAKERAARRRAAEEEEQNRRADEERKAEAEREADELREAAGAAAKAVAEAALDAARRARPAAPPLPTAPPPRPVDE